MSRRKLQLVVVVALALGLVANCWADLGPYVTYPLSQEAKTVAVGDLNGDGRDDVAVAAWPAGLLILYQQSDGTLAPPVDLFAPNMPLGLAIGDLNADGRNDLVVGGTDEYTLLYYQQPDGTFGLPSVGPACGFVTGIAIADLNGDGLADIAQSAAYCSVVLVSSQAPDGTFALPAAYPIAGSNARCICAPDLNSDGLRDLALLVDDQVCWMPQVIGGFDVPEYLPARWAHSLTAGDVTGDGRDDLVFTVATNAPDAAVGVYPQADGGLGPLRAYPAYDYAQPLALLDVNGDGRRDVVSAHGGYEALTVLPREADGGLGAWTSYAVPYCNGYQPGGLASGDLNSDGLPDIALADWWNGLVVLTQTASNPTPADTDPPVLSLTPLITVLWPPNGATVDVPLAVLAEDAGSGIASLRLQVVDEYGLVQPEIDVEGSMVSVPLVASRYDDDADGRTYTLILTATDGAGNVASVTSSVVVPRSNPAKPPKPVKPKKRS